MSNSLSNSFINTFDAIVKQGYQSSSKLLNTVRVKNGVVGATHRFPKMGKGLAQPRIPQTDVIPMNVQNTNAVATLQDFVAPEYSDIYDLQKVNFDERNELAKLISSAMGRSMDQLIIDAIVASNNATVIPAGGVGLTTAKLISLSTLMNRKGVPKEDRYYVHNADDLSNLLNTTEATSSDFNTVKALVQGELDTFLGFKFIGIEDRLEGGLPSGLTRDSFGYHKEAVGLATGIDMRTTIDWIPEKTSWLINGYFSSGAVSIDTDGIFMLQSV